MTAERNLQCTPAVMDRRYNPLFGLNVIPRGRRSETLLR
jgi:hypothetical protein